MRKVEKGMKLEKVRGVTPKEKKSGTNVFVVEGVRAGSAKVKNVVTEEKIKFSVKTLQGGDFRTAI